MIKIKHNLDRAIKELDNRCKTVIPRAAASAINKCAFESRKQLQSQFKKEFKNRTPWAVNQILYQPAQLSQWPHLHARVGTKFKAAEYQVEGGTKRATKPLWNAVPVGLKASDMETRRRRMPSDLLKKKGYKLIKHKGHYYVAYQKPTRKGLRRRLKRVQMRSTAQPKPPLQIIYDMRKQIAFKPKWNMEKTVREFYENNYEKYFRAAFERNLGKK